MEGVLQKTYLPNQGIELPIGAKESVLPFGISYNAIREYNPIIDPIYDPRKDLEDKYFEKINKEKDPTKKPSNLELIVSKVKVKKNSARGMYIDGGTYDDFEAGYWALYDDD